MAEGGDHWITIRSAPRNEPAEHRRFVVVFGYGLFLVFAGLCVLVAIAPKLEPVWKAFLIAILLPAGFGILAISVPDYVLKRTVALRDGHLTYDDFWKSTRISLASVIGAFLCVKDGMSILLVFSRAGSTIGAGHGFTEEDKTRLWAALREALRPMGVPVQEGLSEQELYAKARELDARVRADETSGDQEERERLHTRILRPLALGAILAFMFGFLGWALLGSMARGERLAESILLGFLVVLCLLAASVATRSARLFAGSMYAMGLATAVPGAYLLVAGAAGFDAEEVLRSGGWVLGLILLLAGLFVGAMAWLLRSEIADRKDKQPPGVP